MPGSASTITAKATEGTWPGVPAYPTTQALVASPSPTSAVPVDGVGEFDGVLTGELGNPRVEGAFSGHEMRAWNVTWGDLTGRAVIENAYAYVTDGVIIQGPARMDIDGQFALGYPRRDGGDEIDARIAELQRARRWARRESVGS